jgi:phosphohistidine swiveling domain-containing protein
VIAPAKAPWDPTHSSDRIVHHWTTTNLGEAVPGIITPLGMAHWGLRAHTTAQRVAFNIGVISARERDAVLDPADWVIRAFYGKIAVRLQFMTMIGDRMPGVSGEDTLANLFGQAPPGMRYAPTVRRYPFIAARMAHVSLTIQRRLLAICAQTDRWWRAKVAEIPAMDKPAALAAVAESLACYQAAMDTHVLAMFGSFQPIFDMLERLITRAGVGDLAVLSGTGGAEMAVVGDIWKASRGELSLDQVVGSHGFHGPREGEVSGKVWREDPTPLKSIINHYRDVPDSDDPAIAEREKERRRIEMTREVLAALPAARRPAARFVMRLARERIPDRGRGKRAFLQTIDITRMAARRAGDHFVAEGALNDRDDVFYLTDTELTHPLPGDVKDLVAARRARRELYERIGFTETTWAGMPDTYDLSTRADLVTDDTTIQGTGASAGVVEGLARVVKDPGFDDVEPGEILVAPTTDPSWSSIMFVSAALVVDLGGMLSHAAVIARELEIPCIVNTHDATRRLKTGDRVRVDGTAGTIEILARAGQNLMGKEPTRK